MYDDNRIGYAEKPNTEVEDVEWRPADMRNYGENDRIYDRGDDDGGGRDTGTTETAAPEAR